MMPSFIYADDVEQMVEICAELYRADVRFKAEHLGHGRWEIRLAS